MGPLSNTDSDFRAFLERISTDAGPYRMAARNFLLDEGVLGARCNSYRVAGAANAHADRKTWRGRHEQYLEQRVYRKGPGTGIPKELEQADEDLCPETFRFIDSGSPFLYSDQSLHLIRTEELAFVARLSGMPEDRLRRLARDVVEHGTTAAGFADLDSALRAWTRQIQLRPTFAAFWEDLSALFGNTPDQDAEGWADRLRDRLGLAHYDPKARRGPIDILVFRYEVGSLARISELGEDVRALVPPTVLDGNLSEVFCPSPPGAGTGHTLDLGGAFDSLRREVLHPASAFGARHLWRIGTIQVPVDLASLADLRSLHLLWLREQTGVADYAADTDGDLL